MKHQLKPIQGTDQYKLELILTKRELDKIINSLVFFEYNGEMELAWETIWQEATKYKED